MNSFTQTGWLQGSGGNEASLFERSPGRSPYSPERELASHESGHADSDALELRLALLARAIEHEIIPRLMLAHRSPKDCLTPPAITNDQVSQQDVKEFSKLVLSPDEDLALPCVDRKSVV